MNAILREDHEAPVLTVEQIEVHLSYMRPALDAANAALPVLRDKLENLSGKIDSKADQLSDKVDSKIDQLSAKMDAKIDEANKDRIAGDASLAIKIDQLSTRVDTKVDQLSAKLDAKIDETNKKIDQANKDRADGDAALGAKIDNLAESLLEMKGSQNGFKWFVGSLALVVSAASLAHSLGWL